MRTDVAGLANQCIWDFVHQQKNRRLRAGTGWYSTPFRGGLFGKIKSGEVARLLERQRVDVLWLGATPGVQSSLRNILRPPSTFGDLPSFKAQLESGFFGSRRWSGSHSEPDWNPIDAPKGGWRVYQSLLAEVSLKGCVIDTASTILGGLLES